jgi:hypothetical protein
MTEESSFDTTGPQKYEARYSVRILKRRYKIFFVTNRKKEVPEQHR